MTRLTVAFVRDVLDQHSRDEISFSRMVELLNEETKRAPFKKELGQEPAFPIINSEGFPGLIKANDIFLDKDYTNGMSKRLYVACSAMQGLLSNELTGRQIADQFGDGVKANPEKVNQVLCATAYMFADELLKQEND